MSDARHDGAANFPSLWAAHQGRLLVYIMGAIPQFQDAQDVLQKVAVVAFRKQDDYDPERMEFVAWVRAIARFEILHFRRDHARDRLVFDESTLDRLEASQRSLEGELDDRFAALRGCLGSLQGRSRLVIEMRYRDGLLPQAIADRLRSTANSINVTLSKARRVLRTCIDRHLQAEGG